MKRTVSDDHALQNLEELLEEVSRRDDEVVIERGGEPIAVLISAQRYEIWDSQREEDRERLFEMIDDIQRRNADTPFEVIEREVQKAIEEVRREHRDEE